LSIVKLRDASVGHDHGHLDLLDDAAQAINIWAVDGRDFVVHLGDLSHEVFSEEAMLFKSQAWNGSL